MSLVPAVGPVRFTLFRLALAWLVATLAGCHAHACRGHEAVHAGDAHAHDKRGHGTRQFQFGGQLAWLVAALAIAGCGQSAASRPGANAPAPNPPTIAVSSPYLGAVVRDFAGDAAIVSLAEPGACPGHFDLRPSQLEQLAAATALVRFDFQTSLDETLAARPGHRSKIIVVHPPGGLCDPETYQSVCRQVADALVPLGVLSPEHAKLRLTQVAARMQTLRAWLADEIKTAHLAHTPVVASQHQEAFCRALGLDVVATLTSVDAARPSTLDDAVSAGRRAAVKLVIANRPEGRRLADAVADRLGADVLEFDNFPLTDAPAAFDELVRRNVRALVEGSRP